MPKQRSPEREKAFDIWYASGCNMPLKELAAKLGVGDTQIRKWKSQDGWETKAAGLVRQGIAPKKNRGGAPKGNKNGLGNHGGAPKGNTNGLTTGEYVEITIAGMTDEELAIMAQVHTKNNVRAIICNEIGILTIRERRMLARIEELRGLKDVTTTNDVRVLNYKGDPKIPGVQVDKKDITKLDKIMLKVAQDENEVTVRKEAAELRALNIEEALTRVQTTKARLIADLARLDMQGENLLLAKAKALLEYKKQVDGQSGLNPWGDTVKDMFGTGELEGPQDETEGEGDSDETADGGDGV